MNFNTYSSVIFKTSQFYLRNSIEKLKTRWIIQIFQIIIIWLWIISFMKESQKQKWSQKQIIF